MAMDRKPKILIVDDEEDIRDILSFHMENLGAEVLQIPTGFDAAIIASSHSDIDLMFLDLSMPVMNGWDALREIRKYPNLSNLPVCIVTAHSLSEQQEKAKELGVAALIPKPFTEESIVGTVKKILTERGFTFN
jgi:CheY-like chemotaxis protein